MSVSELQATPPELPLPPLDVGLLLVELEYQDVELPLQHVDLALGQLLLAPPELRLLGLLLQRGPRQLLLPGPQLLGGQRASGVTSTKTSRFFSPPAWSPGAQGTALSACRLSQPWAHHQLGLKPKPLHTPHLTLWVL